MHVLHFFGVKDPVFAARFGFTESVADRVSAATSTVR
jgi:hypothetical protein